MRRLGLACIAVLVSSGAALAQDEVAFEQFADGSQVADNEVSVDTLEALTYRFLTEMLDFSTLGSLTQKGSNSVNTIEYSGSVGNVVQRFHGEQSVSNVAALGSYAVAGVLFQEGTNIAGVASAQTLTFADQLFASDARQLIFNSAELGLLTGSVSQRGSNTANMAIAEYAIGTANQTIALGAVQRIDNRLQLAAGASIDAHISQYGENFGNVMRSEVVETATRTFAGDQIVHNVVTLQELSDARIEQHGINVANLVQSSRIGSISQVSIGTQTVINEVYGPDGQLLTGGNIVQTSDSMVNVTILTAPEGGNDNGVLSVDQNADFPQSSNANGGSQSGNTAVISR